MKNLIKFFFNHFLNNEQKHIFLYEKKKKIICAYIFIKYMLIKRNEPLKRKLVREEERKNTFFKYIFNRNF